MLYVDRWKANAVALVCVLSLLLCLPSFFSQQAVSRWPFWLPKKQLSLGLDLRGGAHLLLALEVNDVRKDWLDQLREDARKRLRDAKIGVGGVGIVGNAVQVRIAKAEESEAALKALRQITQTFGNPILGTSVNDVEVEKGGEAGSFTITPTEPGLQQRVGDALASAIETVRRRVDSMGVAETTVVREGRSRILVQVPGVQDTAELKKLIGRTARLSFHEVHETLTPEEAKKTRVPPGFKIYPGDAKDEAEQVLRETPVVRGEELKNAQPSFDQYTSAPIIVFTFNNSGARKFASFTSKHVGKPFAIVLDDKVISAPTIQEPILGGSGQISGRFTPETATQLAIQLRSGALPAKLTVVQESTVGPSLGSDSIEAGRRATIAGFIGVAAFLMLGYGLFGLFAITALVVNLALIMVAMAYIGAALTLPGIAGIVLTMGMSVDANVLINERIRDERRAGKTLVSALDSGFTRAYGTILDTNMTGLLAALILVAFGSGPVRGFGVTLAIGIVASAFTATTVTRYLVTGWLRWRRPTAIPI